MVDTYMVAWTQLASAGCVSHQIARCSMLQQATHYMVAKHVVACFMTHDHTCVLL